MMKSELVSILILEKGRKFTGILETLLSTIPRCNMVINTTSSVADIAHAINGKTIQLLLYEFEYQNNEGQFQTIKELTHTIPMIALVDRQYESRALESIQNGAQDYLIKGYFDRTVLVHMIYSAIERHRVVKKLEQKSLEFQADEGRLRENEERLDLAIRGSKDGVWDWNLKTNEVYYSAGWVSICGCPKSEVSKSPEEWFKRIHPEDLPIVKKHLDNHLKRKGASIEIEHRFFYTDGSVRWVVARGLALFEDGHIPIRVTGSLRDITDRKQAEEGLRSALAELKFALASEKVLLEELDRKNKDLIELSITDGLTGLYNHRFIQERFDFEFKRARRYKSPLSCMMIDIDHFKHINDRFGHQFGDMVLREISSLIKNNTREVDICGRYGGEEFLIITTQNSIGAMKHAFKLHNAIEQYIFRNNNSSVQVTVSIGVSEYHKDIGAKQDMLERSDIALYQAKQDGRNLIRLWKEQERSDLNALDSSSISALQSQVVTLSKKMRSTYMESTNALLKAVDAKDNYTLRHSENVSQYAVKIAKAMNLNSEEVDVVKYAGLLHDIGKIGIDTEILIKNGSLTESEFSLIRKHPSIGVSILKDVSFFEKEIPLIQHHHEWYNGKGYPFGLIGREIPLGALILSVADAYDSMNTDRVFRRKLTLKEILTELRNGRDSQFFSDIVDVFVKIIV